jgi:hypothetical protein
VPALARVHGVHGEATRDVGGFGENGQGLGGEVAHEPLLIR